MINALNQKKMFFLTIFLNLIAVSSMFFQPHLVFAGGPCSKGGCYNNLKCVWTPNPSLPADGYYVVSDEPCGSAVIGGVAAPTAIAKFDLSSTIGILSLVSRILNFGAIIGGIIVVGNFVSAGLMYLSGTESADTHIKVRDKITYSIVGIVIIVSAYTIVGLMGLIFFKDATFLLNPRLQGIL